MVSGTAESRGPKEGTYTSIYAPPPSSTSRPHWRLPILDTAVEEGGPRSYHLVQQPHRVHLPHRLWIKIPGEFLTGSEGPCAHFSTNHCGQEDGVLVPNLGLILTLGSGGLWVSGPVRVPGSQPSQALVPLPHPASDSTHPPQRGFCLPTQGPGCSHLCSTRNPISLTAGSPVPTQ